MLPYALPLTLGLFGAVAVAVILVEVVPRVIEDHERRRRERERTTRGRIAIAVSAAPEARDGGATVVQGGERRAEEQGDWNFKVRQRKARKAADEDHLLSPTSMPHHVLGSDLEATDVENNENVPLAHLSSRSSRSHTPSSGLNTAKRLTPAVTGVSTATGTTGTAPLFSPALSLQSASTDSAGEIGFSNASQRTSPSPSLVLDAPSTLPPPMSPANDSRSPTLIPTSSSEASPAAASLSTFSSPIPLPIDEENPFADAAHSAKPAAGQLLLDLRDQDGDDRLSDGWVRSPTLNSDAGSSELGDGWTKLSDEDSDGEGAEAEWAKVRGASAAGGRAAVGLGLQTATH
ncbi:hypothetical protein JCM11251_007597 [Rhodosporidiobolus azoricus]